MNGFKRKAAKSFTVFIAVIALGSTMVGCAWLKTEEAKVVTAVESINWPEAVTYWQNFEKGLLEALPVVSAIFKNDTRTILNVTTAVTDANTAVNTFAATVAAYQAGTLTEAQAVAAAKTVETNVVAASNAVGAALAPGAAKPVAVTPVPAAAK